jgi:flavodoxin
MAKVLIVYATRSGETAEIAKLVSASLGGGKQMAQDYGREIGKNFYKYTRRIR